MTLTNATAIVTQLATQITACASWTPGLAGLWYPYAPKTTSGTFGVIEATARRVAYAEGARGLPQADFALAITGALTVGQMETLAESLIDELMKQFDGGLPFRDLSYDLSGDIGDQAAAGAVTTRTIVITGTAGLNA